MPVPVGVAEQVHRLSYVPGLDGIRAVCVLLVMMYHAGLPVQGGNVGVTAFFVLSGFLITTLLLGEHRRTGRIRLGRFYVRRALRLYPALIALVLSVAVAAFVAPTGSQVRAGLFGVPSVLLYYANWIRAFGGLGHLVLLEHTWSLSVEEQFYLLWPLILLATLRVSRRIEAVVVVSVVGCFASLAVRLLIAPGDAGLYRIGNGLDTQADQLLVGCALAASLMLAAERGCLDRVRSLNRWAVPPSVLALSAVAFAWPEHQANTGIRILMTFVAIAAGVVIASVYLDQGSRFARLLGSSAARYIGKRSYGLYLWHYPVMVFIGYLSGHFIVGAVSLSQTLLLLIPQFGLSFLTAALSYRIVERPFLRMKGRWT